MVNNIYYKQEEYNPKYKVGDKVILTKIHPGYEKRGNRGDDLLGKEVTIRECKDGNNTKEPRAYYFIEEDIYLMIREPEIIGFAKDKRSQ